MCATRKRHRQQRDVAVQRVDHEARPAGRAEALHVEDPEHDRDASAAAAPPRPSSASDTSRGWGRSRPESSCRAPLPHGCLAKGLGLRPAADERDGPIPREQARGEAVTCQPRAAPRRRARAPPCSRCWRLRSRLPRRSPCASVSRTGSPVAGSMMWCIVLPAVAPATHGRARRGQATAANRDRLPRGIGIAAVVVGDADPPAAARRCPAGRDVAAEAHERAAAAGRGRDGGAHGRRPRPWRSRRGRA